MPSQKYSKVVPNNQNGTGYYLQKMMTVKYQFI